METAVTQMPALTMLSEEEVALKEAVRDFADAEIRPELIRALARDTFAALCPSYDPAFIESAVAALSDAATPHTDFERLLGDLDVDLA